MATNAIISEIGGEYYDLVIDPAECVFYAAGRLWAFWVAGPYMNWTGYFSSSDDMGATWAARTSIGATAAGSLAVHYNGTYLVVARGIGYYPSRLYYNRATPNADGTITWGTWRSVQWASSYFCDVSISISVTGYAFIGAFRIVGIGQLWTGIWKNSLDVSASDDWVLDGAVQNVCGPGGNEPHGVAFSPLSGGMMACSHADLASNHLAVTIYDGAWNTYTAPTSHHIQVTGAGYGGYYSNAKYGRFSAVSAALDTVHTACNVTASSDIYHIIFYETSRTFGPWNHVVATSSSSQCVFMDSGDVAVLYVDVARHVHFKQWDGSWSAEGLFGYNPLATGDNYYQTCRESLNGSYLLVNANWPAGDHFYLWAMVGDLVLPAVKVDGVVWWSVNELCGVPNASIAKVDGVAVPS